MKFKLLSSYLFLAILLALANISGIHTILTLHNQYRRPIESQIPLLQSTLELKFHLISFISTFSFSKPPQDLAKKEKDLKEEYQKWRVHGKLLIEKSEEFQILEEVEKKGKIFLEGLSSLPSHRKLAEKTIQSLCQKGKEMVLTLDKVILLEQNFLKKRLPHVRKSALWAIIIHSASVIGALILAVVFGFVMASHLAYPIQKLTQEVKKVEEGSWEVHLPLEQKDEIGLLSKAFQSMVHSLSKSMISVNYLSQILDSMGNILILTDKDGRLIRINLAGREFFHLKDKEWEGKNLSQFFPHFPKVETLFLKSPFEWKMADQEGKERYLLFTLSKLDFQNETEYLLVAQDITTKKKLEKEVLETSEREQRRIGQDLHDGLGQTLTGVSMLVKKLEKDLVNHPCCGQIQEIYRFLQKGIQESKNFSKNLYPIEIERGEFEFLLHQLKEREEELFCIQIDLKISSSPPSFAPFELIHIYRILQESIHNAVKHGKAQKIQISFYQNQESQYILEVQDNGKGFTPNPENMGMGIKIMEYRSQSIGASLEIQRGDPKGTRILLNLGRRKA